MRKIIAILGGLLCCLSIMGQGIKQTGSALFEVNYKKLVSRADLVYDQPASRSEAGQPVGNGRMGSLVWTTPSQIRMQINRVDVFASNSSSNNFYERNTDYCGGTGYVDLDFGAPVFSGKDFRQQLSCYDAVSTVSGKAVQAQVLAWNEEDVMAVNVHDARAGGRSLLVNLRTLRMPVTRRGNHSAISTIETAGDRILLKQVFKEDGYYCSSAVVIGLRGSKVTAEKTNATCVRLGMVPGAQNATVFIASAASFDSSVNVVAAANRKLDAAEQKGFQSIYNSNKQWWASFWKQSFVQLSSADGIADFIEKNYTYFLYVMGSSSRGDFPTKFNGMLWTTGGDARQWGGAFWGANQSCYYEALYPTNHLELMDPMFRMYTRAYPSFKKAAIQQWGSKGIFIPETVGFDGVPALPEDIAAEMRDLYLLRKPWAQRSKKFMDYAFTKQPFLSRWNWKHTGEWKQGVWEYTERGDGPYGPVNHIFSRGAKIAYQYWQKYEYTKDLGWLRDKAYPLLKGMAEFYRNFPNVKKERDGKYHIRHVNDNESIWGGHNTVEEISSMMGIFPVVIKASELLNTDAALRPVWKEFITHLSQLPTTKDYPDMAGRPETWVGSLPPTSPIRGNGRRLPDGNTMPVWFFDLCNPGGDPAMLAVANNTFDGYFKNAAPEQTFPHVLSKIPAAAAVLGRADAVRYLIPNQLKGATRNPVLENRMDLSEGFYTTNIQRIGRASDALHLALCQSAPPAPGGDPVIRVFPAWPKSWDARFRLLSRGNFMTAAAIKDGHTVFVEIVSGSGGTCRVQNPWPDRRVTVYKNGKSFRTTKEALLVFPTKAGDRFVITLPGTSLAQLKQSVP
ncbi:glycosyl hydrolase family 95 catalytic domain-containing protein [Niabella aurantiaca]|uniref:glycosyl hydrolase family 95 catalytic domain-containing protein n=1 Tax=Niabella aurantiaca TaxID=379900 RepID=UPI0003749004|nr:glycoside hydrolase N-terminal domain-containing protein [Niabella aurantiaca]